jgi:hypothetical protein
VTVSFFNELDTGKELCSRPLVSFFNELATEKKNYAHGSGFNPQISVSFFNELATERKTMLIDFVSFFNELSTEFAFFFNELSTEKKKLCSRPLLDHGFQEDNALEGIHVKGQTSIMASKRSSLDGRKTLWKEYMSTTSIRVGRSGSNIPIEEMTMSTTRSKSGEGRDSLSCRVECMGQVIT